MTGETVQHLELAFPDGTWVFADSVCLQHAEGACTCPRLADRLRDSIPAAEELGFVEVPMDDSTRGGPG